MLTDEGSLSEKPFHDKEEGIPKDPNEVVSKDDIEGLLRELPIRKQLVFRTFIANFAFESNWKSIIPPPEILNYYNNVFENGGHKLFLEFQKELDHRIAMDKVTIPEQLKQARSGQIFAFIIALTFLAASFILVLLGHGIYGMIIGSVNLVALVTIFVLNKRHIDPPIES